MDLKQKIRNIPDFPKKGVVFRDITTLVGDVEAFKYSVDRMVEYWRGKKIDAVLGAEARGFIFGGVIAYKLGVGFIPVRKPGKLPYRTCQVSYDLEYGKNILQIHIDAIKKGDKILIVDDLVATGGTAKAKAELVEKMGGEVVGFCFLIELEFLNPRKILKDYDIFSLIKYESE
ncbi:Adenine phosphoribosyltransferase [subsurface metagenome]|nr:adenine phosphoribosyltransferase [Clostridia bacterium]TET14523.1 MAG: adenine phosphoribosyltransferase [Actinomycetota bacterium]